MLQEKREWEEGCECDQLACECLIFRIDSQRVMHEGLHVLENV